MANQTTGYLFKEDLPDVKLFLKEKAKKICRKDTIWNLFPCLKWIPTYRLKYLIHDFVAGLTVGLTAIPQAIAYGALAKLGPEYGLYSAFMGCFVYIIFGTCKDITIGPTAIMALMVQQHAVLTPDFAVLLCFLSGIITLVLGILNMGFLVQFISHPVTMGFCTAAAITIGSGQVNNLFGIKSPSNAFYDSWKNLFTHFPEALLNDSLLGVGTLIFLICLKKVKDCKKLNKHCAKYLSLSRNAVAVIFGTTLAYFLSTEDYTPFRLSDKSVSGLPAFKVPPFSTTIEGKVYDIYDIMAQLGSSIISIPLITILETIAIAKAFNKGKTIDASQEMIALGISNILGSFVSSMPTGGSFTRTAINNASGVKTTLGGAVTGGMVLLALAFLASTFHFIPKASLSAIIIGAMIFMVEYEKIVDLWKAKKADFLPFLITLICCLFWSLEYGMLCGMVVSLVFILYSSSRPRIKISLEKMINTQVAVVNVCSNLKYTSAEYLRSKVIKFVNQHSDLISVVLICGDKISSIDSTVAENVICLKGDLSILNCEMICWNWTYNAAGVICRLKPDMQQIFKFTEKPEDAVRDILHITTDISSVDNGYTYRL